MKYVFTYPTKHHLITEEKRFLLKAFNYKTIEGNRFKEKDRKKDGLPERYAGIGGTLVILGEENEAEETHKKNIKEDYRISESLSLFLLFSVFFSPSVYTEFATFSSLTDSFHLHKLRYTV